MSKYSHVRRDLESARERLDGSDELDVAVSLVLDQVIETLLKIEYMKASTNVIDFPNRKMSKLEFLSTRREADGRPRPSRPGR